jgi:hypothetical protein
MYWRENVTNLDYRRHYGSDTDCPAYSPDPNSADLFVGIRQRQSLTESLYGLKSWTERHIFDITAKVLHNLLSNFGMRLEVIVEMKGQHSENIGI